MSSLWTFWGKFLAFLWDHTKKVFGGWEAEIPAKVPKPGRVIYFFKFRQTTFSYLPLLGMSAPTFPRVKPAHHDCFQVFMLVSGKLSIWEENQSAKEQRKRLPHLGFPVHHRTSWTLLPGKALLWGDMWDQSQLSRSGQLRSVLRAVWCAPLPVLQKGQLGLCENELVIFLSPIAICGIQGKRRVGFAQVGTSCILSICAIL